MVNNYNNERVQNKAQTIFEELETKYTQNSRGNNSSRLSGDNSKKNRVVVRRLDNNL